MKRWPHDKTLSWKKKILGCAHEFSGWNSLQLWISVTLFTCTWLCMMYNFHVIELSWRWFVCLLSSSPQQPCAAEMLNHKPIQNNQVRLSGQTRTVDLDSGSVSPHKAVKSDNRDKTGQWICQPHTCTCTRAIKSDYHQNQAEQWIGQ